VKDREENTNIALTASTAVDNQDKHWLIETKGMDSTEVVHKDLATSNW